MVCSRWCCWVTGWYFKFDFGSVWKGDTLKIKMEMCFEGRYDEHQWERLHF